MMNPLHFYKLYGKKYPILMELVQNIFCGTSTSVPAECLFSHVGLVVSKLRNRLSPSTLETLIMLKENLEFISN